MQKRRKERKKWKKKKKKTKKHEFFFIRSKVRKVSFKCKSWSTFKRSWNEACRNYRRIWGIFILKFFLNWDFLLELRGFENCGLELVFWSYCFHLNLFRCIVFRTYRSKDNTYAKKISNHLDVYLKRWKFEILALIYKAIHFGSEIFLWSPSIRWKIYV
jgi:hypothetical protein